MPHESGKKILYGYLIFMEIELHMIEGTTLNPW